LPRAAAAGLLAKATITLALELRELHGLPGAPKVRPVAIAAAHVQGGSSSFPRILLRLRWLHGGCHSLKHRARDHGIHGPRHIALPS